MQVYGDASQNDEDHKTTIATIIGTYDTIIGHNNVIGEEGESSVPGTPPAHKQLQPMKMNNSNAASVQEVSRMQICCTFNHPDLNHPVLQLTIDLTPQIWSAEDVADENKDVMNDIMTIKLIDSESAEMRRWEKI